MCGVREITVAFWLSDAINISSWIVISSRIVGDGGLSWWEAWLCVWIGYIIISIFICISGRDVMCLVGWTMYCYLYSCNYTIISKSKKYS